MTTETREECLILAWAALAMAATVAVNLATISVGVLIVRLLSTK